VFYGDPRRCGPSPINFNSGRYDRGVDASAPNIFAKLRFADGVLRLLQVIDAERGPLQAGFDCIARSGCATNPYAAHK